MSRLSFYFSGILMAILLTVSACGPRGERFDGAPMILITIDTLRSDHLPTYGYDLIQTPAIERFARDSVVFEKAYAHVPLTLPSHANLMTGLLPAATGVRDNLGFALDEQRETLAERLKAKGYRTGAVVSSMVLRKTTGIAQGFDFYDDHLKRGSLQGISNYAERLGGDSLAIARQWLNGQTDSRFFLWLHLYDPHAPYGAPPSFKGQSDHPYDDEILYTDHLLAQLFDDLKQKGWYDKAVIVLTSDHGEGFGEHGEHQHGLLIYREMIQVPLMIKLPEGKRAGERQAAPVGLIDVAPTLLGLQGMSSKADGIPLFSGRALPTERNLYSESWNPMLNFGWLALQSVIRGNHHYIKSSQPLLFDLDRDPEERDNLYSRQKPAAEMTAMLDRIGAEAGEQQAISEEDMALLASLGYTGSFSVDDSAKSLSEKAFLDLFNLVGQAKLQLDQGLYAQVEKTLVDVVTRFPGMVDARMFLGSALSGQGKHEQAEYVYTEALALSPKNLSIMVALVGSKLDLDKREEAEKLIENAVAGAPKLGPRLLMPLLDRHKLFPLAEKVAVRVLQWEPEFGYAELILAKGAVLKGELDGAQEYLNRAKANSDRSFDPKLYANILHTEGDIRARQNRPEEARSAFADAISLDPDHEPSRTALTLVYFSLNQPREAVENLDSWVQAFPSGRNIDRAVELCEMVGLKKQADFFRKKRRETHEDK